MWLREYGGANLRPAAEVGLEQVLESAGAQRLVVGHTPQARGINSIATPAGAAVWRIDTGMAAGMYRGPREVLEIRKDGVVRVLSEQKGAIPAEVRTRLTTDQISPPPPPPSSSVPARETVAAVWSL